MYLTKMTYKMKELAKEGKEKWVKQNNAYKCANVLKLFTTIKIINFQIRDRENLISWVYAYQNEKSSQTIKI